MGTSTMARRSTVACVQKTLQLGNLSQNLRYRHIVDLFDDTSIKFSVTVEFLGPRKTSTQDEACRPRNSEGTIALEL